MLCYDGSKYKFVKIISIFTKIIIASFSSRKLPSFSNLLKLEDKYFNFYDHRCVIVTRINTPFYHSFLPQNSKQIMTTKNASRFNLIENNTNVQRSANRYIIFTTITTEMGDRDLHIYHDITYNLFFDIFFIILSHVLSHLSFHLHNLNK
jgi:hypothetical protein